MSDHRLDHDVCCVSVRPGVVSGRGLHKHHEDRSFQISGEMRVALCDVRPDSSTCGDMMVVTLSEPDSPLLTIPPCVWRADHDIDGRDAVVLNMPAAPCDHLDRDRYRLPLGVPLVPHGFGTARAG